MKKIKLLFERLLLSPWHFLFFSVYFVFRLYDFNIYQVPFLDFVRPLVVSVLLGLILYFLFGLLVARRWQVAALMTSTFLFGFYLYSAFWPLANAARLAQEPEVFAAIWALFILLLIIWIGWKTPRSPGPGILAAVNLMAILLLLNPMLGTLMYFVSFQFPFPSKTDHTVQGHPIQASPDIYYIILDAYTRADVLAEEFGHDNGPFIQALKDLGFYVAECSQSNYESTPPSLTSSFNLDYIQNMSDTFRPGETEQMGLFKLLDNNNVQETVSNFGYKTVAFASGFFLGEWRDAHVFISPPYGPITEFETLLMRSTYLQILDDLDLVDFEDIRAERFRMRTRLILNSFEEVVKIPGPKFVFMHLVIPHEPFAFDAMGNPIPPDPAFPRQGYTDQVKFINKALLPKIKRLVEESPSPPVIILQGDHGPWIIPDHTAQMKILNAYYLPKGSEALYSSISPVNSFRVVFNEYFDADFHLLEDKSYYAPPGTRYDFKLMPNTCPQQ